MVLVNPKFVRLISEVNLQKEKLCSLIVERESLIFHICKSLKVDYMLKIGILEYDLMKVQDDILRNKSYLELFEQNEQRYENDKENLIREIKEKVDSEFLEFEKIEKKQLEDIDIAIDLSVSDILEKDELEELNHYYYNLQLFLNPALKLTTREEDDELYEKIKRLYKKGDIRKLKKISENYVKEPIIDEVENLEKLSNRFDILIDENQKLIDKIKTSFPYNQKNMLEEETFLRRKKECLNSQIYELSKENEIVKADLNKYMS